MTASIALKNAESALVETRAFLLRQLGAVRDGRASAKRFDLFQSRSTALDAQHHMLTCALIVLDVNLEGAALRKRIFAHSSALYRGPRRLELRNATARRNRIADRAAC